VDLVTRSAVATEIFGAFPFVRRIHRVPAHGLRVPWRLISLVFALRSRRYDLAIDPCVRSQSDRIGVLAAKATWKLGYAGRGKSGVMSHGVPRPADVRHVGQLPVYLLRSALRQTFGSPYPPLDIYLTEHEREQGRKVLTSLLGSNVSPLSAVVGLFADATGSKNLGSDWWQRFAQRLVVRYPDQHFVEILPMAGISLLDHRFPTFYSSDVRRLAGVLSALSLFVSADCGVMHLACAAGSPTVGVFSVTDPTQWGPYGARNTVLQIGTRTPEASADLLSLV
jgi:ADP-heptose:LPS heptosyltransferase